MNGVLHALCAVLLGMAPVAPSGPAFDHALLDSALAGHVREGRVDYAGIRAHRLGALDGYLDRLAAADPNALASNEQLAFFINLYNASLIRAVIARTATRGATAAWSPADSSFAVFHEPLVRVRGGALTLDSLENGIVRPRFREPRIHVALVCGARSCPPLLPRAYRGSDLDATLAANLRAFTTDTSRNRVDATARTLELSRIFEWYAADFVPLGGAAAVMGAALGRDFTGWALSYRRYDWTLNAPGR